MRRRIRDFLLALSVTATLFGCAASGASALPNPFFGFQASGNYENNAVDMNVVARSGAKFWRVGFSCFEWKANPSGIWETWDVKVRLAWERGITIFPVIGGRCVGTPSFALPRGFEWEGAGSDYELFINALVNHYGYAGSFWTGKENKREIGQWEIMNEPNLAENGLEGVANGFTYGRFFKRASEILHAAQGTFFPTAAIFGGLYYGSVGANSETPHDFMKEAGTISGLAFWVNGVGIHPYAFGPNSLAEIKANISAARTDADTYFPSGKSLWITEVGWPIQPWGDPGHEAVTLAEQATRLKDLFEWVKKEQVAKNIQSLIFYMYRDFDWADWTGHSGVVGLSEGEQREFRPAWFAYQEQVGAPKWSPQTGAVQANTGAALSWRTHGGGGSTLLGMAPATSPSITGLTSGGFWGQGYLMALQTNTGVLHTWNPKGQMNLGLNMAAGTSPSVAGLAFGHFVIAIHQKAGSLYTWSTMSGANDRLLGMAAGTSPSVAGGSNKNYAIAIQANTGNLMTWTPAENGVNRGFGMAPGTSPSIAILNTGEMAVAFQANTGALWTWTPKGGAVNTVLGMAKGTSPSIAALPNGSYAVAFQANTGALWNWTPLGGAVNTLLGMAAGTSPSIAALPAATQAGGDAYVVGIQANTSQLITWTTTEGAQNQLLGMAAGTSPAIESGATPFPSPPTE